MEGEGAEWSSPHAAALCLLCPLRGGISTSSGSLLLVFFDLPYSPFQVMVFCPGHMLWGSVRAALLLLRNPIICKLQRLNPALNLCSANASSS